MARTKLQMQDVSDVLRNISEAFQAPELVTAPFTTITDLQGNARKLSDPSKIIKTMMPFQVYNRSMK